MSTTPQTVDSQAQPQAETKKKAYKPRKSVKAPAIQSAVLAKRASGQSKLKIKRDLGISYNTVTSIIELNSFDEAIQKAQNDSLSLIPKALRVADARLEKGSETMAIEVLRQTIWPLNKQSGKPHDTSLTLAINNLMGNVTVQSVETKPVEQNKAIDVKPSSDPASSDK